MKDFEIKVVYDSNKRTFAFEESQTLYANSVYVDKLVMIADLTDSQKAYAVFTNKTSGIQSKNVELFKIEENLYKATIPARILDTASVVECSISIYEPIASDLGVETRFKRLTNAMFEFNVAPSESADELDYVALEESVIDRLTTGLSLALETANNAQNTANNAQNTANNAQNTANNLGGYKVGAIIYCDDNIVPARDYGGQWEQIQGKMIIGANDTYMVGSTGGDNNIVLSSSQLPLHTHPVSSIMDTENVYASNELEEATSDTGEWTTVLSYTAGYRKLPENQQRKIVADDGVDANRGESINIMNPYQAFNIWRKIAD